MTQHDFVITLRQMLDHAERAFLAGQGKTLIATLKVMIEQESQ